MIALFEWGNMGEGDPDYYAAFVDGFLASGDANADGFITWSEFNDWLSVLEYTPDG
jgi:hypothetical protein